MDLGLQGKTILITGAGAGIGQAIALAFAAEGARVAVNDLTGPGCEETLARLRAAGAECAAAVFDVSRPDEVAAGVAQVESQWGPIDVLVNNAALMVSNVAFVEKAPQDCEREIAVGLFGVMHCTRAVLKGMVARGEGRIVNIVSDAARVGNEKEAAYSGAKGGVIAFTKSLAREVGPDGITVNAVSPAATDTPLRRAMLQRMAASKGEDAVAAREEKVKRAYPMRRIGQPQDTASMVAFLASAQASWVTGQVISVNGGFAMPG